MNHKLKGLNQILEYKFNQLRLFGKAEQKGPILNILIERLKGDVVNTSALQDTVKAAVDASLLQGIRKVNIYIWCRNEANEEPEWTGGFEYTPLPLPENDQKLTSSFRQDYSGIRVLFFCLAILLGSFYVLEDLNSLYLIPPILALVLGSIFPFLKRRVNRHLDNLFRRIGLGIGSILIIVAVAFLWQHQLSQSLTYNPLFLLGILLIALGL